jgi:hypothetical protein
MSRTRYPTASKNHVHTTRAYIPVDIARALSANPTLVQKPIESFYTRDAIQLRVSCNVLKLTQFVAQFEHRLHTECRDSLPTRQFSELSN